MTLQTLNQYGADFQIKVLSSLLTHKDFLVNIHDIISGLLKRYLNIMISTIQHLN